MDPSSSPVPSQTPPTPEQKPEPAQAKAPPITPEILAALLLEGKVDEFNERRPIYPVTFRNLQLKGLNLDGVNLNSFTFDGCAFKNCSLVNANFSRAWLDRCTFESVIFNGSSANPLFARYCEMKRCSLQNVNMESSEIFFSKFFDCVFDQSSLKDAKLSHSELAHADLEKINGEGLSFYRCELSRVRFTGSNLANSRFPQTLGDSVSFRKAFLRGADLQSSAWLGEFVVNDAYLSQGSFREHMFPPAKWENGDLLKTALFNADPPPDMFSALGPKTVFIKPLIDGIAGTDATLYNRALEKLSGMIGLEDVKREVRELAAILRINKRREMMDLPTDQVALHYVFGGPPGTGKTTVARILGDILKSLGYLSKGHFIETDRSGLVGRYLGETSVKTKGIVMEALGGVLFIDEAYTLTPTNDLDTYAQEAVATLLKLMEDYRHNLVVIAAGYGPHMDYFLNANPGLRSRFSNTLPFKSLSVKELTNVFEGLMKNSKFVADDTTIKGVAALICHLRDREGGQFGNARVVRNVLEKMARRQAVRLLESDGPSDVSRFCSLDFSDIPCREMARISHDQLRELMKALPLADFENALKSYVHGSLKPH